MDKAYIIKDTDELILNGHQLREWKSMIIEDYKKSEYPNTSFTKGRREGYKMALTNFQKMIKNWDVEPCCHGIRLHELQEAIVEVMKMGDARFKMTRKKRDLLQKYRQEVPPRPYSWIARELKVSVFTCVYWGNKEVRRKKRLINRKRRFGRDKEMEDSQSSGSGK